MNQTATPAFAVVLDRNDVETIPDARSQGMLQQKPARRRPHAEEFARSDSIGRPSTSPGAPRFDFDENHQTTPLHDQIDLSFPPAKTPSQKLEPTGLQEEVRPLFAILTQNLSVALRQAAPFST
jgi:hypothetical protein